MPALSPTVQKFILHWGEMGTRWGVNRTVAQIHALLYLSERPLQAEEIAETLAVARSNVSNSLRELQSWGLVRTVHVLGERRDHFETSSDVWELFTVVMDERKKREIDPTVRLLNELVAEVKSDRGAGPVVAARLTALRDFAETTAAWYAQMRRLPRGALVRFFKMGGKVAKALGVESKGE
jgi:DNA-binding transcriptional regulator GbsR (MarR family)